MKKSHYLIIALLSLSLVSCLNTFNCTKGSGEIIKSNRELSGFSKIYCKGSGEIYFKQSDKFEVIVETDDNIQKQIITEVKDGALILRNDGSICTKTLNYYISAPNLNDVVIDGSADLRCSELVKVDKFNIEINGSGDIKMKELNTANLKIEINGTGDVEINGQADNTMLGVNGSGDMKLMNLKTKRTAASINGSGDITIACDEELNAKISGSGDIRYIGSPKVQSKVIGSGDIEPYKSKKN